MLSTSLLGDMVLKIRKGLRSQSVWLLRLIVSAVFLKVGSELGWPIAPLDGEPALATEPSAVNISAQSESVFSSPLRLRVVDRPRHLAIHSVVHPRADAASSANLGEPGQGHAESILPTNQESWRDRGLTPPTDDHNLSDRPPALAEPELRLTAAALEVPSNQPPRPDDHSVRRAGSAILGQPTLKLQGVYKLEGSDSSARARLTGLYPVTPDLLFGAVVDWSTGRGFADSLTSGLSLNELYVAVSPSNLPRLRLIGGLMDYTSYFDRNSFAKDGASQFFNQVFQTNPALSATGLTSRVGLIANWSLTDDFEVKGGVFSSRRSLSSFALDGYVGEADWRIGTFILRGTYLSAKDADQQSGFAEIFQFDRGNGNFGLSPDDRENTYAFNAEYYVPQLNIGFFGRYGHYSNSTLGEGGDTYSVGATFFDLLRPRDRLGIGYGQQLSNSDLRRQRDDKRPDILEVYYDMPILPYLRGAVMVQARDQFSDLVLGFRLKTTIDLLPLGAPFRR